MGWEGGDRAGLSCKRCLQLALPANLHRLRRNPGQKSYTFNQAENTTNEAQAPTTKMIKVQPGQHVKGSEDRLGAWRIGRAKEDRETKHLSGTPTCSKGLGQP